MKLPSLCALLLTLCISTPNLTAARPLALVPYPTQLSIETGKTLTLPGELTVRIPDNPSWVEHVEVTGTLIERISQGEHQLRLSDSPDALLQITKDDSLAPESYTLHIDETRLLLKASSLKGLAHGTATIMQLLGDSEHSQLPCLEIDDAPRTSYRNFMIDMGRNPHSVALLKETIDLLWFYKVDSAQLHLTDDQRIAFPSTAFPNLWDGLITLDEFRELEAYAVTRGVTLIPELEVPGHSSMLLKHYPDVFGKNGTELASSPKALKGIKTLLDEMMDVFPSTPYIHVGGDEAFGVPEEYQRDLINTLHEYLKSKGKQTLVWEGPRPGKGANKVNTEVIHLNWRTINYPADQMLKDGYRVVNASWDPLYLVDHYPRTNFTMTSPQHIYETMSLTRFKHVNPGIPTYSNPIDVQPTDQLLGFCMPWWEGREENYFAQIVPRIIPFAEVAWNPEISRDYSDFASRSAKTESVRRAAHYPVSITPSQLSVSGDSVFQNQTQVTLTCNLAVAPKDGSLPVVRYTLDGSEPTTSSELYVGPLTLSQSSTIRAAAFLDDQPIGHGSRSKLTAVDPTRNKALGKPVTSSVSSGSPFSVDRITDGGTDNLDFYLGYPASPEPISITIDLESIQTVNRIDVVAYTISGSYEKYTVECSTDGIHFEEVASRLDKPQKPVSHVQHELSPRDVRFVRIRTYGNRDYVFNSFSKIVEVLVY
ncbi:family 20 glycosylhydrolase [Rhodopirellula sallentina]|nr:family 20 glycosylhydrolase [Rhodopirellula sallentina]